MFTDKAQRPKINGSHSRKEKKKSCKPLTVILDNLQLKALPDLHIYVMLM